MAKRETVEEFLQRGGKITLCPPQPIPGQEETKVTPTTPTGGLMTLADGAVFYSEIKPKVKKVKPLPEINLKLLPASLWKYAPKGNN